jgi:hypothetical protein
MFCQSTIWIEAETAEAKIRIRNLSSSGLMGETDYPLERGEMIIVEIRNIGERRGRIVWTEGRRFGVKFARPIDPRCARQPVGMKLLEMTLVPPVRDHTRPAMRTPLRAR